jgi:hypothetical protein
MPPDPASLCPLPEEGTSLYLSRENGVCFLYPVGFTLRPDFSRPDTTLSLMGPMQSGDSQEKIAVSMGIAYNGPADGLDSSAYFTRWMALNYPSGSPDTASSLVSIGGLPAVQAANLPGGMIAQRGAFLVANGIKYQLALVPRPEDLPELAAAAAQVWDTVTRTLVFFPPQNTRTTVRAADVCPTPGADTRLYQSDLDGYCFLYPAGFDPAPDFPGEIVGGPLLFTDPSFGEVRTSLTLGTFGSFPGQTPRQVLEPRGDLIDAGSITDATMGGFPAVTFRNPQGPWASKQAMISVNGMIYTIVAQPFEPDSHPDGIPYLDQLWNTVAGSLAFFDPFR